MKGKSSPIIIGTRGSDLALWQANFTKNVLEENGLGVEIKIIKTKGDATQQWDLSFDKIDGKGFFTKELEDALLAKEIDLAVHSCKDLPTENSPGLLISAYSTRANPFDLLLIKKESVDETKLLKLKSNAVVGTSSARRKAQLLAFRADLSLKDMRGNVPTRVNKLKGDDYDGIVLASAGLDRLKVDLSEFESVELKAPMFIPAPAQGVLAFQIRSADEELKKICSLLNDTHSELITNVERQILHDFQGGCQVPLGVYSYKKNAHIHTWVSYAEAWNEIPKRTHFLISTEGQKDWADSENLIKKIKEHRKKEIFITSEIKDTDYIKRVLEAHEYIVRSESFIKFSPITFSLSSQPDWLFFSSKNGVKFFFDNIGTQFNPALTKIAAINSGTANAVHELGFKTKFIGEGSDLEKIAADFDQIASGKIAFPQAKKSMQSIQQKLKKNTDIETLVIYENQPKKNIEKREEELLIFTSPMSAEAYFSQHTLSPAQTVISIGNTTTQKLDEMGVSRVRTAYEPTHWSLVDEVFSFT
jgi:hydroxymethylbilane synthase